MKGRNRTTLIAVQIIAMALVIASFFPSGVQPVYASSTYNRFKCDDNWVACAEAAYSVSPSGAYTGHDEPSVLYYSNVAGSGNSNVYYLTLPKDPKMLPTQDGKGGTFNFQLHPAFWFGMAMCDSMSAPNPGMPCQPDTDANIFDSPNPSAPDYIGKHPGAAFMEMQFYPPGWVSWPLGNSCDSTKWCAALNIDSLSENDNTGQLNNTACLEHAGLEYVNFAFITRDGKAQAPANPVDATMATFTPDASKDLFMNSGDRLVVLLHDTPHGFQVVINDLTTGQTGLMTASADNSFGQVQFAPDPSTQCNNIPYDFHPMYSTSSEHTRVPWTAHSYNVAFSDEIGHFEYCNAADPNTLNCTQAGVNDPAGLDNDDYYCFNPSDSLQVAVGGCIGTDLDFDGVPYQNTWPGSISNAKLDRQVNPSSILFTSPLFNSGARLRNYDRVAFETDLPRIEAADLGGNCDRDTGAGCTNPPAGANFYPIFSTRTAPIVGCQWQLGGSYIPGTKNTFGGNSTAEYGSLLKLFYPEPGNQVLYVYEDYRQVLSYNPCAALPMFTK